MYRQSFLIFFFCLEFDKTKKKKKPCHVIEKPETSAKPSPVCYKVLTLETPSINLK